LLALFAATADAQTPHAAPAPAPPYSLPWLLRPAVPGSVVRLDQTMALYENATTAAAGTSALTGLIATYKLTPRIVPLFRITFVHNDAPAPGPPPSGSGFSNPVLGANYLQPLGGGWRWSAFLATTIPVGSGGGDDPDAGAPEAMSAAIPARSAMDDALFAVNYWTVIGGLGIARVTPALTLQAEVTVLQLTRARGPETQDKSRTNLTAGVHAGHFFSPKVSVGGEVRMQRWMTNAAPVRNDPAAREQLTFGVGPRLHFQLGKRTLRPGLSYTRAFDATMSPKGYDILQLDVPIAF
jgi:hypothetical protein